ncbi:MAG: bifunctional alpha/beta hydrolase/OsmC family protein [Pseudomonadota bacterium]
MRSESVSLSNRAGLTLQGSIDWPATPHRAVALFAHCFTCTSNLRATRHLSEALTRRGIAVMRFDFTGLGNSEGEFSDTTFASNVTDLIDAAAWLAERELAPDILVGHSLGGTATLLAASEIDSAVAVATIGSPADAAHVSHLFSDRQEDIRREGKAQVMLAGRPFVIGQALVDDLQQHPLRDSMHRLRKALLIMHAPLDATVEVSNAQTLFEQALHPKSFVSLDRADHLLSDPRDSRYAGEVLGAWAARFLPEADIDADNDAIEATTYGDSFTTGITSGPHALVADEPASVGGRDEGPSPVQLLSAALASCTSMTLQMYAKHKGLKVDRVHVSVTAASSRDQGTTRTTFHRDISIDGNVDAATKQRMLEIADRCPVHRSLHGDVTVTNTLIE